MSSPGKPGSMSSRQAAAKGPKPSAAGNAAEDSAQPHVYVSIQKLIESVGVEEYEPQVVDMIVDFIYSYTTDVLRDAQAFGDAAGQTHGKVNLADVELAIHSRADMSFAQAPNLEALFANSDRVNSQALPAIISAPGLPLPPTNTLLTANVQYRRDGDDPATVAGNSVCAEPAVPVPAGVPLPGGPSEVRCAELAVPAMDGAVRDNPNQEPSATTLPAAHNARDAAAAGTEAGNEGYLHEDVDMLDDVPFVPPP